MIERHSGRMQLVCEECGTAQSHIYDADEFDVMVADAKADGWKIAREAGEWAHTCPDCAASPGGTRRTR